MEERNDFFQERKAALVILDYLRSAPCAHPDTVATAFDCLSTALEVDHSRDEDPSQRGMLRRLVLDDTGSQSTEASGKEEPSTREQESASQRPALGQDLSEYDKAAAGSSGKDLSQQREGDETMSASGSGAQSMQAHSWLMWASFGVLMPAGIIISRHVQTMTKAWFHIHLTCMILSMGCILAGGIIRFVNLETIPETPAAVHFFLGLTRLILACLYFVLSFVGLPKENVPRVFSFTVPFALGMCAVVFAWYSMFSDMDSVEEDQSANLQVSEFRLQSKLPGSGMSTSS